MSFVQTHLVSVSLSASPPTPPRRNHAVRKKYQFIITSFPVLWVKYMMPHAVGPCPVPPKSPKTRAGKDNFLPQNEQHLVRLLAKSVAHERANQGPPQSGWKCIPAPPKPRSTQTNFAWKKHCQRHNWLAQLLLKSCNFFQVTQIFNAVSLRVTQPLLKPQKLSRSNTTSVRVPQPLWESRNLSESRPPSPRVRQPLLENIDIWRSRATVPRVMQPLQESRNPSESRAPSPRVGQPLLETLDISRSRTTSPRVTLPLQESRNLPYSHNL